jgi:nucleotide-binding universal stress UspA family protein
VLVMGTGGPFDAVKVDLASRIAFANQASIRFLHVTGPDATSAQRAALEAYHANLSELCSTPTSSDIRTVSDREAELLRAAHGADLAIVGATVHRFLRTSASRDFAHRLAAGLPCPAVLVHAQVSHRRTVLGAILERIAY